LTSFWAIAHGGPRGTPPSAAVSASAASSPSGLGLETMLEVCSSEKNLPLYHLAFFSKHPRGYQFWKEACKYGTEQLTLFD
jgi:hypothetical protein